MKYDLTITFFGLILIIIIDGIYLNLNKNFYKPILEDNLQINYTFAIITWLIIIIAIQLLVLSRPDINDTNVLVYGLILGFCLYGVYNFTNASIYENKWNNYIIYGDILWGMILTTVISYSLFKINNLIKY